MQVFTCGKNFTYKHILENKLIFFYVTIIMSDIIGKIFFVIILL